MAQHPETLANAAHAAWNCGRPKAAKDLADLIESFGAAPIQDVIRMKPSHARPHGAAASESAAKERAE